MSLFDPSDLEVEPFVLHERAQVVRNLAPNSRAFSDERRTEKRVGNYALPSVGFVRLVPDDAVPVFDQVSVRREPAARFRPRRSPVRVLAGPCNQRLLEVAGLRRRDLAQIGEGLLAHEIDGIDEDRPHVFDPDAIIQRPELRRQFFDSLYADSCHVDPALRTPR